MNLHNMKYRLDEARINCICGRILRPHVLEGLKEPLSPIKKNIDKRQAKGESLNWFQNKFSYLRGCSTTNMIEMKSIYVTYYETGKGECRYNSEIGPESQTARL